MILAALATSSNTVLAASEWKALPWHLQGAEKTSMDTLLDIVVDVPALRATKDRENLVTPSHYYYSEAYLINSAIHTVQRLEQWQRSWKVSPSYCEPSCSKPQHDYPRGWAKPLFFTDLETANCYCLYHAAVILTLEIILTLPNLADHLPQCISFAVLAHKQHQSAVEICRTIDFHLGPHVRNLGHLFILWPLRMAHVALKNNTTEVVTWLDQRLHTVLFNQRVWKVAKETTLTLPRA